MENKKKPSGIKSWPEDDGPREKLFREGEHKLSKTELLAILLRSGVKGQSAIDLARKILEKFKTFRGMSHTDLSQWKEFKGLGIAKATAILGEAKLSVKSSLFPKIFARSKISLFQLFYLNFISFFLPSNS